MQNAAQSLRADLLLAFLLTQFGNDESTPELIHADWTATELFYVTFKVISDAMRLKPGKLVYHKLYSTAYVYALECACTMYMYRYILYMYICWAKAFTSTTQKPRNGPAHKALSD